MCAMLRDAIKNTGFFFDYYITRRGIARRYKYAPRQHERMIDRSLREKGAWTIPDVCELQSIYSGSESYNAWKEIPAGYKWLNYFPIYDSTFQDKWDRPIKILEIGVARGASLLLWRRLFKNAIHVVGIDVADSCKKLQDTEKSIFVEIGAQQDIEFLKYIIEKFGGFDVIIDDGSHISSHQIASFNFLFKNGLADIGTYLIEDTHTAYYQTHRDTRSSIMDFAYSCIDVMHRHHFDYPGIDNFDLARGGEAYQATYLARALESVKFFDSVIVFEKNAKKVSPVVHHL